MVCCHPAVVPEAIRLGTHLRYNTISLRSIPGLVSPGGLLLLAAWALQREELVRNVTTPYAIYFCFGALLAASLLSWYHNYARVLCLSIATGIVAWAFARTASGTGIDLLIPSMLLPLNFILFAWLSERGVLTLSGLMKFVVIGLQVVGVVAWTRIGVPRWEYFRTGFRPVADWTWMPWPALLLFAAAGAFLLFLSLRRHTKIGPALMWSLAAVFAGLHQGQRESVFLYIGAAGMILLLGVLEHGYDIAYIDELTGLPSRRAFNEALRLLRGSYAIAMCDVDLFKNLNDTYGHDAGDQVLKMIAGRLSNVRGGGRVFRHGGEEFAILFRKRTAGDVLPVVESLREAVAATEFQLRESRQSSRARGRKPAAGNTVKITISIGFADRSDDRPTPEIVLKAADEALYLAKESGRNCVRYVDFPASEVVV